MINGKFLNSDILLTNKDMTPKLIYIVLQERSFPMSIK